MNERVVLKMTNFCVVKLSNSPAITQHKEVPVPRRQDVDERPCVPRLELDHFESQPDSPRTDQRFLRMEQFFKLLNSLLINSPVATAHSRRRTHVDHILIRIDPDFQVIDKSKNR